MTAATVQVETELRVATITLAWTPPGGAISGQVANELRDACSQVERDEDVWVVVLTGKGEHFCGGSDPSALHAPDSLRVATCIADVGKPVIAAIDGDAMDQGLEVALACDIRVASNEAKFGMTQAKDGLIPWDGGTQRLPRLIGRGRAMDMILSSRIVDAQDALSMGLVSRVVEPGTALGHAQEMASAIARHGPIACRYLKEAVFKGSDMTLEQGLSLEADLNLLLQSTGDRAEGIRSFLERRDPRYRGE